MVNIYVNQKLFLTGLTKNNRSYYNGDTNYKFTTDCSNIKLNFMKKND